MLFFNSVPLKNDFGICGFFTAVFFFQKPEKWGSNRIFSVTYKECENQRAYPPWNNQGAVAQQKGLR